MKSLLKRAVASARVRARSAGNRFSRTILRLGLSMVPTRTWLNCYYNKLKPEEKCRFHSEYWNLFRDDSAVFWSGVWELGVSDKVINLPLTPQRMWLDWDHGISLLGHDLEVKRFYSSLLRSQESPEIFFDVGANYGTHSLLFMCLGIPAVTFEPNSTCHPVFKEMCALNDLTPDIQHVAISSTEGDLELRYPEKCTWLGSVKANVCDALGSNYELIFEKVTAHPLDSYLHHLTGKKSLIKVDTEGNELEVFKGASRILSEARPIWVFESNANDPDRNEIADLLNNHGYEIYGLCVDQPPAKLGVVEFIAGNQTNFAAWPQEKQYFTDYDGEIFP